MRRGLLDDQGDRDVPPGGVADVLLLVRDVAVVGFDLDDPARVRAAVREALARILAGDGAAGAPSP
ncbi:hypothetical protein AB0L05_26860 [Nonomuraea pusilla]|uniref:hypothetical protein n=1 Tax=Nonomuraea pusilla TaxID=46177 RepID=UPI0033309D46